MRKFGNISEMLKIGLFKSNDKYSLKILKRMNRSVENKKYWQQI